MKHTLIAVCCAAACLASLTACGSATSSDEYLSPQAADAAFRAQEFIRRNAAAESEYTFAKVEWQQLWDQLKAFEQELPENATLGCIMRLFDAEKTVCPSEKYNALMLGKIWAMFGEPNDPSTSEDFFNYTVSATAADGTLRYLELYQHSGMPSVGGIVGDAASEKAAKALAAKVCATEPVDYTWSDTYEDFDVSIRYFVKDGVAGVEEHWPDGDGMDAFFASDADEDLSFVYGEPFPLK